MTPEQIAADRAIIEKATPGPWLHAFDEGRPTTWVYLNEEDGIAEALDGPHDATFIAASRTRWPAALDALEEAQKRIDYLEEKMERAMIAVAHFTHRYNEDLLRIKDLEAAIQPFAEFANGLTEPNWVPDTCPVVADPTARAERLSVGDFRRAAAVLTSALAIPAPEPRPPMITLPELDLETNHRNERLVQAEKRIAELEARPITKIISENEALKKRIQASLGQPC